MGRLIYSAICSLDGYIADETGGFDWAQPDAQMHSFINDLEISIGTYLYGRRMYQVMAGWETQRLEGRPPYIQDYAAIWRAAQKVVYSRSLQEVHTARTRIEREFDPEEARRMKASSRQDISVGGPDLAGQAIKAGLVDVIHLFFMPVMVGGGHRALPDGARLKLELHDHRRFHNGAVHMHYRVKREEVTG